MNKLARPSIVLAVLAPLAWGCGSSVFGGQSARSATPAPASANATVATGSQNLSAQPPANATPEQTAIGHCLQAWGTQPFGQGAFTNFRKIDAAVSVFGGSGYVVEDTQPTSQPALIVIDAGVSVLGSANYLLMNPNGWYCLMVDVNVLAQFEVDLQCQAHLADSQVQVNVGSSGDPAAAVGVNVLSSTKVVRKPSANGASGC